MVTRIVVLGDSYHEGVGDTHTPGPNGVTGWADRMIAGIAATHPDVLYANVAVRGKLLRDVLEYQVPAVRALNPDIICVYAGGNDVLRPHPHLERIKAQVYRLHAELAATGAKLVTFTSFDPWWRPIYRAMRGRAAIFNEFTRVAAARSGAMVVDQWALEQFQDPRQFHWDRLHLGTAGHHNMAIEVARVLGFTTTLQPIVFGPLPVLSWREEYADHVRWAGRFAAPWVGKRLRGISSGDSTFARYPAYVPAAEIAARIGPDTPPAEPHRVEGYTMLR